MICCTAFTIIVYLMSAQPMEWIRFAIFLGISILVVLVAQTFGLLVGAVFSVVVSTHVSYTTLFFGPHSEALPGWSIRCRFDENCVDPGSIRWRADHHFSVTRMKFSHWHFFQNGTFLAPTLSVPMMMFAGFGVSLRDMPAYLQWGTYVSYLRFGLEGYVGSIYGLNRRTLACTETVGKSGISKFTEPFCPLAK